MNVALALYLYRVVYVSFIVFASAKTFIEGLARDTWRGAASR